MKNEKLLKTLSRLILTAQFISTLFYSLSYPYIYAETLKVVPNRFISLEQILGCLGTCIFCTLWNKFSDKLFNHYRLILWVEMIADTILFTDVLIRHNLNFYFMFNVIIYSIITRNLACGGVKLRAKANPTEKLREKFDNNSNIIASISTILGATIAMIYLPNLTVLFIFAYIGNVVDNIFYLYIYHKVKQLKITRNT